MIRSPRGLRAWCATLSALVALAAPLRGQVPDSARREPLFDASDAVFAGAFVVGTAVLAPLDAAIARKIQGPRPQGLVVLQTGAVGVRRLAVPGALIISGALYATGRVADRPALADAGLHSGEAILLGGVVTTAIKGLAGRARPYRDPGRPYDFGFGRGFGNADYQSFPSGHTMVAFAAAAAFAQEVDRWAPDSRAWAAPLLYGTATLVGISRVYNNYHWASDVVAGAALGSFSGWKVVQYSHDHPSNELDRVFLASSLAAAGAVLTGAPPLAAALPSGVARDPEGALLLVWTVPLRAR